MLYADYLVTLGRPHWPALLKQLGFSASIDGQRKKLTTCPKEQCYVPRIAALVGPHAIKASDCFSSSTWSRARRVTLKGACATLRLACPMNNVALRGLQPFGRRSRQQKGAP
jgi:hypothetical protein